MAGAAEPSSRVVWLGQWELPRELEARHIAGRLGKARCRAARACRGLRAAVRSAQDLGAFRHRVQAVAAGGRHSVVCTGDAVFSFGAGFYGQLGYAACAAYSAYNQPQPRMVRELLGEDVVAAAASTWSTLVCTAKGRAYWFGALAENPRWSSRLIKQSRAPRLLGGLERVAGVAGGDDHLLAWTRSGELYTWGRCGGTGR